MHTIGGVVHLGVLAGHRVQNPLARFAREQRIGVTIRERHRCLRIEQPFQALRSVLAAEI